MTQTRFPRSFDSDNSSIHASLYDYSSVAIALDDLTFAYPHHPKILDGIDLHIGTSERVGVIGPNGAGKTTLFMLLSGIFKPTQGMVKVFNAPVIPGQFRSDIGLVFQNPDDQLFAASVRDDVAFGPENMGLPQDEVDVRVREALKLTGMSDHAERPPHHLSGGEKRMVAIAGVMAMLPRLIIYDEPSANLDMRARRRLIQFLQHSHETMLISSHDLEFILEVCDRVILLDAGAIVADGKPSYIMGDENLMLAHGLEKPHSLIPHAEPHHG
ncbi:MAG: ABC transporter ATP-binding protein [Cyanobacteria bacterium J06627_8]